jgi:acetolactate synthase-1/2/3 large subunit
LAVAGDGGLLMSLMELSTLAEQKSNVVMVVLNDSAYGMMWVLQQRKIASLLHPVNFAKVAEGFGIKAWRVNDPSELSDSYAQAFSMSGPALVDVAIDYKQRFPYETIMEDFRRKYPGD